MLENDTILKLKRSHSDADNLIPFGEATPPQTPANNPATRTARSFSFAKLTESIKGKGPSSRSRSRGSSSADNRPSISGPIVDPRNPLCPPTPEDASPAASVEHLHTAHEFLRLSIPESTNPAKRHSYSSSDPTVGYTPPACPRPPARAPPPIPRAPSITSLTSTLGSPLERIHESPLEESAEVAARRLKYLETWFKNMEPSRLQPPNGGTKYRAIQEAKQMEALVAERAKRSGDKEPPPYDFYELIGKGAYGRVYKGKNRIHGGLVAIKIIDIDNQDYQEMTTENLAQTIKEIDILQQLRDSKARPYVNIIEEARTVHNELWIVSEYASGGSVNTLMKPTHAIKDPGPGLPEKFIIPIARELALGLKYVHEAGVIHRDLKTNNVLILEDGRVQLCDFGVSGTLEPQKSKRSTIVGTPAWMAPELQQEWVKDADPRNPLQPIEIHYGNEIDIWAYGCTIHEMASGFPPHHKINQLELPNAGAPELEGDRYSQDLKDFLAFVFSTLR